MNARPPFTPTADQLRLPSTPMPNELRLVVSLVLFRPTAPACSIAYCRGFWVMFGSVWIISLPTAPETLLRSVCSRGASAVTITVSPTRPIVSSTGTRTVSAAARLIPVRV